MAATPTTNGVAHTGVPVMDSGRPLPSHDEYGAGIVWEQFDLGNFTLHDSKIADFGGGFPRYYTGWGQLNVYDLTVSGALPEDFSIHFDAYDHVYGTCRSVFAPFSHDATYYAPFDEQELPPVPEPISMVMFGCVGAGMAVARKLRRKKA